MYDGQSRQWLNSTEFEDGDEITISPMSNKKPKPNFERVYWAGMMTLMYGSSTKLYDDKDSKAA